MKNALAATRWVVLEPSTAANNDSPPKPGHLEEGARLFYVTARGRCWLVRDEQVRVQLTPAALPRRARLVDVLIDTELGIIEEAADLLDQRQPAGIYHASEIFYFLSEHGDAWMLYGREHRAVPFARLPPDAVAVDVLPHEITVAIDRLKETG
jgi:hypothetical protein